MKQPQEHRSPDQDRAMERAFIAGKLPEEDRRHRDNVDEETRRHESALVANERTEPPRSVGYTQPAPPPTGEQVSATKGFTEWGPRKVSTEEPAPPEAPVS